MKTVIKTTLKGNESISIKEKVEEVYNSLMDKGGFCLFTRLGSGSKESKMIVKKSVVKMVVTRD
nr:hypothetical protein [uncultured Allomuricauda sp.]